MSDQNNATTATQPTDDFSKQLDHAAEVTKEKIHQDPAAAQALATTPDLQDEIVEIEKDLLGAIISRLDENKMSPDDAQKFAKEFLSILPIHDKKDLLVKLTQLNKDSQAAQGVYLKYAAPHEEDERQKKLKLMSEHIQAGNIEHALAVAKGGQNG
jgi:hypothetical protein